MKYISYLGEYISGSVKIGICNMYIYRWFKERSDQWSWSNWGIWFIGIPDESITKYWIITWLVLHLILHDGKPKLHTYWQKNTVGLISEMKKYSFEILYSCRKIITYHMYFLLFLNESRIYIPVTMELII